MCHQKYINRYGRDCKTYDLKLLKITTDNSENSLIGKYANQAKFI